MAIFNSTSIFKINMDFYGNSIFRINMVFFMVIQISTLIWNFLW